MSGIISLICGFPCLFGTIGVIIGLFTRKPDRSALVMGILGALGIVLFVIIPIFYDRIDIEESKKKKGLYNDLQGELNFYKKSKKTIWKYFGIYVAIMVGLYLLSSVI